MKRLLNKFLARVSVVNHLEDDIRNELIIVLGQLYDAKLAARDAQGYCDYLQGRVAWLETALAQIKGVDNRVNPGDNSRVIPEVKPHAAPTQA